MAKENQDSKTIPEVPEEEKKKMLAEIDKEIQGSLPFKEWGIKKKDQADVRKAFEALVGLEVGDVMRVAVNGQYHPDSIVFVKHCGPNQKLVWDRKKQ